MSAALKKGVVVRVISGGQKGSTGSIQAVDRIRGRVSVSGAAPLKKAVRRGERHPQGGFSEVNRWISVSNVVVVE